MLLSANVFEFIFFVIKALTVKTNTNCEKNHGNSLLLSPRNCISLRVISIKYFYWYCTSIRKSCMTRKVMEVHWSKSVWTLPFSHYNMSEFTVEMQILWMNSIVTKLKTLIAAFSGFCLTLEISWCLCLWALIKSCSWWVT